MNQKRAVFLDRDGTVVVDRGYLDDASGIELLPGAAAALARLTEIGYLLVLVTNQSGVGRGLFSLNTVAAQHRRLRRLLAPAGVDFAAVEVCPHAPQDECSCRKPAPGMLRRAAAQLHLDLSRSFMVGDKEADVQAGLAAGCRSIRIGSSAAADRGPVCRDLAAAVAWIEEHQNQ